eukprot:7581795-Pyramimonas_sp.AAC.1
MFSWRIEVPVICRQPGGILSLFRRPPDALPSWKVAPLDRPNSCSRLQCFQSGWVRAGLRRLS